MTYHWSESHYNFYCWGNNFAITHTSYTTLIVEELICVMCVCVSLLSVCLFLYYIRARQFFNSNARGINFQLHAHHLHNNNCWGANCVIIPAPMVCAVIFLQEWVGWEIFAAIWGKPQRADGAIQKQQLCPQLQH